MFKTLKYNRKGVVFVTVLIIIIISMVLAISALSINVGQVKSTESEIRHIQARTVAEGGLARLFQSQLSDSPQNEIFYTEQIGNTTYTINAYVDQSVPGPAGSDSFEAGVNVTF